MNDDELTPYEKKSLESLPKERMPRAELEDRVVRALRGRGALRPRRKRYLQLTFPRLAAVAAACMVLVFGGFTLGRWSVSRAASHAETILPATNGLSVAATLQQAGSAYVLALENFASLAGSSSNDEMRQGREVALTTLYTATDQVTRIVPGNYLAAQLLQTIEISSEGSMRERAVEEKESIWF